MVDRLHQPYLKALADKAWTQKMADPGIHLLPETQDVPDALAKHTAAEVAAWRKLASAHGRAGQPRWPAPPTHRRCPPPRR